MHLTDERIRQLMTDLRDAFDARLITEVQQYGGIPSLPAEEVRLREAVAAVLMAAFPNRTK